MFCVISDCFIYQRAKRFLLKGLESRGVNVGRLVSAREALVAVLWAA